jgi:hypothetical protein
MSREVDDDEIPFLAMPPTPGHTRLPAMKITSEILSRIIKVSFMD